MRNLTPSRRESTASRPSEAPVNNKHFIYDSVKKIAQTDFYVISKFKILKS